MGNLVNNSLVYWTVTWVVVGPDNVVGIATGYGMGGPGIESRWGDEIFYTHRDRPWGPPSLLYDVYRVSYPVVKRPRLKKE